MEEVFERGGAPVGLSLRKAVGIASVTVIGAVPLAFALWYMMQFGASFTGISYLRGEMLVTDRSTLLLEEGRAGEVRQAEFTFRNIGPSPLHIVGAYTNCTCVVSNDLPLTVPGNASVKSTITARYRDKGDLSQTIVYYTDCPTQPSIPISVKGMLLKPLSIETRTGR